MRIAFLVVDDRFGLPLPIPFFGTAPQGLLYGFAELRREEHVAVGTDRADNPEDCPAGVTRSGERESNRKAGERGADASQLSAFSPQDSDFEIHVICCTEKSVPAPEKLAKNIWYHQIVLPHWSYLRTGHLGPVLGVRRLLRRIKPDIIHAQGTERWCAISAALAPYPKVLTIHGNLRLINKVAPMEPRLYWKAQEILETFSIPRFDGVVCITNYTQQNVSDLAKKTWVIPNAVDPNFFELGEEKSEIQKSEFRSRKLEVGSWKSEIGTRGCGDEPGRQPGELRAEVTRSEERESKRKAKSENSEAESSSPLGTPSAFRFPLSALSPAPTILVVAHIQGRKNQNAFIDAIAPLADSLQFRVRFFGRGAPTDDFGRGFFERIEKYPWCSFEGMKGREELREAFRTASLLVLPSLEDNCPMSVLEAMASGVPVVASNVGGVPDLIRHEENGLLVNPNDLNSMRDAVNRMLTNPELANRLAAQAHLDARAIYHPTVIARRHLEVYREVIRAKRGR